MYLPNVKFVDLPVHEIIAIAFLGSGCKHNLGEGGVEVGDGTV